MGQTFEAGLSKSPGGKTSPIRGRTMKEYEEQQAQLKKENFNLKLRIYFLEERMGQIHDVKDKEEAIKNNIALKVETETLRKELSEKQELLVQAAKALDLLEEQHKDEQVRYAQEKGSLDSRIQELEKELHEYQAAMHNMKISQTASIHSQFSAMTQSTDSQYSSAGFEIDQLASQVQDLQEQLRQEAEKCCHLEEELRATECRCQDLQSNLDQQTEDMHRLEELVGARQPDLYNRIKRLAECENQLRTQERSVAELKAQLSSRDDTTQEMEARLSKSKANAANLTAKLNVATKEVQRLREEVKLFKRQQRSESTGSNAPGTCSLCQDPGPLQEAKRNLREHKLRLCELQGKLLNKETELVKIQDLYSKAAARDQRFSEMEREHHKAIAAVQGFLQRLQEKQKEIDHLRSDCRNKDNKVTKLTKESEKLSKELEKAKKDQEMWHQAMEQERERERERDSECHLQSVRATLHEKEAQLVACEQRLEARDNRISELEEEVESLRKELQRLSDERCRGLGVGEHAEDDVSPNTVLLEQNSEKQPHEELVRELEEKKKEIEKLNKELKKRTYNLQELVNKELWDKNKQIERLELRLTAQGAVCDRKDRDLMTARRRLAELGVSTPCLTQNVDLSPESIPSLQEQLKVNTEERKYLTRQVDELRERLRNTPERDSESRAIQTLKSECVKLKEEVEQNNIWRREAAKALSALRTRLEELAIFLDELMHQPALLVGLCADRQRALREAVDGSLELSRTIANLSGGPLSPCNTSNLNHSLSTLIEAASSLSLLDNCPRDNTLPEEVSELSVCDGDNSPLKLTSLHATDKDESQLVARLRNQVEMLKEAVKQRDIELTKLQAERVPLDSDSSLTQELHRTEEQLHNASFDYHTMALYADSREHLSPPPPAPRRHSLGDAEMHNTQDPLSRKTRRRSRSRSQVQTVVDEAGAGATVALNVCGSQSESETWSEPDRSVSQARMGIQDEGPRAMSLSGCSAASTVRMRPSVGAQAASSSSSESQNISRASGKRSRSGEASGGEVRRLAARMRCLEKLNQALRTELHIFNQIAIPAATAATAAITNAPVTSPSSPSRTNRGEAASSELSITSSLLDEIRRQREKLESSLFHNDYIRSKLEDTFSGISQGMHDVGSHDLWEHIDRERGARMEWEQRANKTLEQLQASRLTISELQEQITSLESRLQSREAELLERQCSLLEIQRETERRERQATQTQRTLEDKVQELSVQVLEVEVRREQAEQDAQRAMEERDKLRKDFEHSLSIAEKQAEEAKREATQLRTDIDDLQRQKLELEQQIAGWKEKAQEAEKVASEAEKDIEDWKTMAQKFETDMKEVQARLSGEFKEKLHVFEQLKEAAERRAEDWRVKYQDAETKRVDTERRAKEKVRLAEEQSKLKQAEVERRAEEQLERHKLEAESRAAKKLNDAVQRRARELDAERRVATDRRLQDAESVLRSRLDDLEKKASDAATEADLRTRELEERNRVQESNLKARLAEVERRARAEESELRRQLDEAAVATSQAQLETARLANERLQLEQQVRWLQGEAVRERRQLHEQLTHRIAALTQANMDLQKRVKDLEREVQTQQQNRRKMGSSQGSNSAPATPESKVLSEITNLRRQRSTDMSDYVSEEPEHEEGFYPLQASPIGCWYREPALNSPPAVMLSSGANTVSVTAGGGRVTTASPDLGIESDQGRFSSLEPHPLKKSTTAPALHTPDALASALELRKRQQLDYHGLEQENLELKQRLQHTRHTLEQTYAQLAAANQRKRLVEKAICKQLNKTHHILRRARDNFEANSGTNPQPDEPVS